MIPRESSTRLSGAGNLHRGTPVIKLVHWSGNTQHDENGVDREKSGRGLYVEQATQHEIPSEAGGAEAKDISHNGHIPLPLNGNVVFAHFLSEADYNRTIGAGERRFSAPTENRYINRVDKLMCRLGLSRFVGQPYVSLFALTPETYKESLKRGQSHALGGNTALSALRARSMRGRCS